MILQESILEIYSFSTRICLKIVDIYNFETASMFEISALMGIQKSYLDNIGPTTTTIIVFVGSPIKRTSEIMFVKPR